MRKLRPLLLVPVVALVFALGIWLGIRLPQMLGLASQIRTYNTAIVIQQVQTLAQLVTVKYVVEKVVVLDDVKWFGENRVLLVAHGVVKAGVDLSQLQPGDIVIHGQSITIHLPPPQITDTYLDDKQTYVVERTTGVLREFDKDLEETARQNAVDDIRRAARQNGILRDASERAELQLKVLFHEMGFQNVEVTSHKFTIPGVHE